MNMSLRLPDEVAQQLRESSAESGMSMNQAAIRAIAEWLERRKTNHVLDTADEIMERHTKLLSRLGDS